MTDGRLFDQADQTLKSVVHKKLNGSGPVQNIETFWRTLDCNMSIKNFILSLILYARAEVQVWNILVSSYCCQNQ